MERVRTLVERIKAGIHYQQGCQELHWLYYGRVRGFFARREFTPAECEDLTQETFLRAFNEIEGLQSANRFPSWLFVIAANIYRNEVRRRRTDKRDVLEEPLDDLVSGQAEGTATALGSRSAGTSSPFEDAVHQEQLDSLRAALRQLPPQMRRCLYLRLDQGLKYREIAVVMRISIQTVKAHLNHAQRHLRVILGERPDGE